MITERDIAVLFAVVRYYVLNRQQIQRLVFPSDPNGRVTRRRLQTLVDAKLINRQAMLVCHPMNGAPAPVYYPSRRGCEVLAEQTADDRFLATPTTPPLQHHILHWLAVTETHIAFDEAATGHEEVKIDGWLNEWDVVNKDETAPEKRYRVYTLLRENPRLVCAPDSAFLLSLRGHSKVFYLEQDRATSGVQQIASSKTQGYAVMAERELHRKHFPEATVDTFTVLMIAPTARRRDALRKAIENKPGAALWRFASIEDLKPETLFTSPVFYPSKGEPAALVRAKEPSDA
jgi:hypothetical protein